MFLPSHGHLQFWLSTSGTLTAPPFIPSHPISALIPQFFSEPSIFLHGLECFEGKEIELNSEVRSLQAEGFNNHVLSVRVKGGM